MVVSNFTKQNFGLLFQKWSLDTQESFCKVSDQLDTLLYNYGLISWHTSSINCVNNCTFIFTRHQPRLFLKALLVTLYFNMVANMDISGADPGGGGPGVQGPPLVPREGVLDPSSKMKKTAFFICFIYYPAIMPQNSSQILSGHQIPNPQLHMESFIQVLIHLWHVEILIVCVLDKITVLFSISISSKIYLKNSDWSTDWSWWETKTYIFIVWIT